MITIFTWISIYLYGIFGWNHFCKTMNDIIEVQPPLIYDTYMGDFII